MICPNCGKNVEEAKFCPECGTPVHKQQDADTVLVEENASAMEETASAAEPNPMIELTTPANPESEQSAAPTATTEEYYAALQRNEQEKAKKKKKRRIGCLSAGLVFVVIMFLIGLVRGAQLSPDEKEQVKKVTEAIEVLPKEVTLKNADNIEAIMKQYEALNEKQQKKVKNRKTLLKADETIDDLKVEEVEKAISAIGTVTADSGNAIKKAEDLYDALPEELQKRVSYNTLEKAEKEYDAFLVDSVKKQIDSIGTVSLKSKELLDAIAEDYEQLSEENKTLVTNYGTFTEAVEQYEKLQKEQQEKEEQTRKKAFADAVKDMRHKVDEISEYTWYYPKAFPQHINTRSYFLPYLSVHKKTGEVNMRLKVNYFADDWIFWTKLIISIDGNNSKMNFNYYDVNRDNHYGDVWEYVDIRCDADDILLLRAIANSEKTLVRFQGDMYRKDMTISENDKASIRSILNAYDAYYGN